MDPIMCNRGHWRDPRLIDCPRCLEEERQIHTPSTPLFHVLLGVGIGFYTWHKTHNTFATAVAAIAGAWFFQTKLGRIIILAAVLVAGIYLASVILGS